MQDIEDRESAILVDVSMAGNSAQAVSLVEDFIKKYATHAVPSLSGPKAEKKKHKVNVHAGSIMLTHGVLAKISQLFRQGNLQMETVYSTVPQTQQAALDEGFFVKESPLPTDMPDSLPFTSPNTPSLESESLRAFFAKAPTDADLEKLEEDLRSLSDYERSALDLPQSQNITPQYPLESRPLSETLETPPPTEPLGREVSPPRVPQIQETPQTYELQTVNTEDTVPTLYLKQNLRSGKTIRYDGNIIIVGDVHAGSEITATGDITVWGELKGIAHAGSQGNYRAEIRALKIEAIQLRIADYIARRPDRIFYHKGMAGEGSWAPELAKVADGEIKITQELIGR